MKHNLAFLKWLWWIGLVTIIFLLYNFAAGMQGVSFLAILSKFGGG